MEPRHILIAGDRGMGKSTLIRKLLGHTHGPVYGFFTNCLPQNETGYRSVYIHPAFQEPEQWRYAKENLIGTCYGRIHNVYPQVFDSLGVRYLSEQPENGIVVMDELGFMEVNSPQFTRCVLEALDGNAHVLAAVKSRTDIPFLEAVKRHPKAKVYCIEEQNRDALYQALSPIVESWET